MYAIMRIVGILFVQDTNEAEYPDMLLSVLDHMDVSYCITLENMGNIIADILQPARKKNNTAGNFSKVSISKRVIVDYDNVARIAEHSIYACPDCGGGLWGITKAGNEKIIRYHCHIGHSY